jgi:predicted GNAT family acetyltransferase
MSRIKSEHHPYPIERFKDLWVLRDGPGRKEPRKIEIVASDLSPRSVVEEVNEAKVGWHFLCHIHPSEAETKSIRESYKSLGYRAVSSEWMFVHDLQDIPVFDSEPPVRLVATQAELDQVPQVAKHKLKLMLNCRQFGVFDEERDYGWVRSIPIGRDAWVSNLYVHAAARGRGFGRALMSSLLRADRENGVETSVLLASSSGARLYPHLGYRQIAVLQMFCPADRARFAGG